MTRIPLNRAYEQSQDLNDKLEMSTAEIGLAVRTTNCLEERRRHTSTTYQNYFDRTLVAFD